jgi:hypothetical protein
MHRLADRLAKRIEEAISIITGVPRARAVCRRAWMLRRGRAF